MKTAMQELIEHIQNNATKFSLMNTFNILKEIEPYLEIEKRQHETTFHRGINIGAFNPDMDIEGRNEASKHYYESAFVHLNNQTSGTYTSQIDTNEIRN
jgi:hypothetical protein